MGAESRNPDIKLLVEKVEKPMTLKDDNMESSEKPASPIGIFVILLGSILGTLALPFLLFLFLKYF